LIGTALFVDAGYDVAVHVKNGGTPKQAKQNGKAHGKSAAAEHEVHGIASGECGKYGGEKYGGTNAYIFVMFYRVFS